MKYKGTRLPASLSTVQFILLDISTKKWGTAVQCIKVLKGTSSILSTLDSTMCYIDISIIYCQYRKYSTLNSEHTIEDYVIVRTIYLFYSAFNLWTKCDL